MNNQMFDIVKDSIRIDRRNSIFDDWRDWFILENKQPPTVYETVLKIYIENYFVKEILIPINLKTLATTFDIFIKQPITIKQVKYIIPEMSILRIITLENPLNCSMGDSCTLNTELNFFT